MGIHPVTLNHLLHDFRHGRLLPRPLRGFSVAQLSGILGVGIASVLLMLKDGNLISFPRISAFISAEKSDSSGGSKLVPGLQNLGNNCFLNVVLQSFASCDPFYNFLQNLVDGDDPSMEERLNSMPLTSALLALLNDLSALRDERVVASPRRVMHALELYVTSFDLTRQQDAAEALLHLLSSLKEEIISNYVSHFNSLADVYALRLSKIFNSKESEGYREWQIWKQHMFGPFNGTLGSILTCKNCSFQAIIQTLRDCTKYDDCNCKNLLLREGILWPRGICSALKQLTIGRCPEILCIHLQRATISAYNESTKLQGHVAFPLILDLYPYTAPGMGIGLNMCKKDIEMGVKETVCLPRMNYFHLPLTRKVVSYVQGNIVVPSPGRRADNVCQLDIPELGSCCTSSKVLPSRIYGEEGTSGSSLGKKGCIYSLVSVVQHHGISGSGHFTVYRRVKAEPVCDSLLDASRIGDCVKTIWFKISDSCVSSVPEETVLASEASLLFYERMNRTSETAAIS
ncbi:ubiquitin carboxyl-terminal hydrolase 27 isoform X2 [Nymphaea colorata]|uniref:ubiquitin carboxyl-terminal hydrolase 27 isoform X2 n=1 Tax=Nymphaea colorata TaxID=210225 RepID=UPI00129D7FF0|nr:ubiquitin carboxyl-terminal hydrolase 27 isoform X2 [Nymphaea colorata]